MPSKKFTFMQGEYNVFKKINNSIFTQSKKNFEIKTRSKDNFKKKINFNIFFKKKKTLIFF